MKSGFLAVVLALSMAVPTALLPTLASGATSGSSAVSFRDAELLNRAARRDDLGARIRFRQLAAGKLDASGWEWLRVQAESHPEWGEDLLAMSLERAAASLGAGKDALDGQSVQQQLEKADSAMLSKKFQEAADVYRSVLAGQYGKDSKRVGAQYLRLALVRALYGAKKFDEARAESIKIPPSFSRFRHVLFERMWSAFRAGRADVALGDIAAQRSAYFGPYLEPEAYLVLVYLLKRLCRDEEAQEVIKQMEVLQSELESGKFGMAQWARLEVGTRMYLELLEKPDPAGLDKQMVDIRNRERKWVSKLLEGSFVKKRKQWMEELPQVISYSRLAVNPLMGGALQPIEKFPNREKMLERGYEIWPVSDGEQWLDELGNQRFMGDSRCAKK